MISPSLVRPVGGEMLGVFVTSAFDSEIIDDKTEKDRTGSLGEETVSMLSGDLAEYSEMLYKVIVRELAV
jgi:hypothetical protein